MNLIICTLFIHNCKEHSDYKTYHILYSDWKNRNRLRQMNRKETSCLPLLKAGFEPIRVSDTKSPADWMLADKPTELLRIKLNNLNSTARPYDQRAFSPLDPTAVWHSHLALAIYMFVVVNFDALAQASDIRIERRQVVFLCWRQDSNPLGSQTPNRQHTFMWFDQLALQVKSSSTEN